MVFKRFVKTGRIERRVDYKNGDYDYDYDGDEGYWEDVDVDWDEVNDALVDIIIEDYNIPEEARKGLLTFIKDINSDDSIAEMFKDELQEYFEEIEDRFSADEWVSSILFIFAFPIWVITIIIFKIKSIIAEIKRRKRLKELQENKK